MESKSTASVRAWRLLRLPAEEFVFPRAVAGNSTLLYRFQELRVSFEGVVQNEWRALVHALHHPDGLGRTAAYRHRQMERVRWGRRLRKAKRVIDSLA